MWKKIVLIILIGTFLNTIMSCYTTKPTLTDDFLTTQEEKIYAVTKLNGDVVHFENGDGRLRGDLGRVVGTVLMDSVGVEGGSDTFKRTQVSVPVDSVFQMWVDRRQPNTGKTVLVLAAAAFAVIAIVAIATWEMDGFTLDLNE